MKVSYNVEFPTKKVRGTFTKEIVEAIEMFLSSNKETACFESDQKGFSKKAVSVIKRHYDGSVEATESCGKVFVRKCKK
jgi:hypothetical protein